ncbi:ABC transporter permease [Ferrimonas sp. SCSIO 43195]|uniref:ABC transporter permease n=1 Tax=Ferrimonas sp. SCSIO 43195 TaxID=2822844 RepID=UPI002075263C|nr:ABC transporter permease [Ferrimonas sp. SCSIO 43195]USD39071.1 ABC transporter permease [Ferrimonas sp. SCSIO 43195]
MMRRIWILLVKELRDAIRDRRSILAAMSYSLSTPLIFAAIFMSVIHDVSEKAQVVIHIEGASHGPDLVRFLASAGIVDGDDAIDITLTIPSAYPKQMTDGLPAQLWLTADSSDKDLQQPLGQIRRVIEAYSAEMAAIRLVARGINPKVIQPLQLNLKDRSTNQSKSGIILGGLLLAIMLSLFFSGMNVAIDTSAGERERNSLALLLCQPIATAEIVAAKAGAVALFSIGGLLLTLVVSVLAFSHVPWQELGFSLNFDPIAALIIVLVCLPIGVFAATLQLYVSFFAKSFKEAQTYLTIILMLPTAMIMAPVFDLFTDVLRWLPISGQQLAFTEMLKGEPLPLSQVAWATLSTLTLSALLFWANVRALKSEKVVFAL